MLTPLALLKKSGLSIGVSRASVAGATLAR
jgi:hypothetical protein